MEDKDTCTTELFLTLDRTVEFGDTDGPIPLESSGSWEVAPDTNDFSMTVTRKFNTGAESTDMGEFTYERKLFSDNVCRFSGSIKFNHSIFASAVVRTYTGEMTKVGDAVGITGVMHNMDDLLGDEEIGFFNMIDATDERVGDDKKVP